MSGDESSFDEQLAALGRLVPADGARHKALEAARQAVEASRAARQRIRRRWMKTILPSGIAAGLIAAAVLVAVMPGAKPANAAEQLQEAVAATDAYQGWVHWNYTVPPSLPKATKDLPVSKKPVMHFNAALGIQALEYGTDGDRTVEMVWTQKREAASYSRTSGEIRYTTLSDDVKVQTENFAPPITTAELIMEVNKKLGRDPLSVKETADGDRTRFDVVLFKTADEATAFAKSKGTEELPTGLMVWVNKDKLITRIQVEEGDKLLADATVTYGPPEIKDIYDLGVPRDAKVVDMRVGNLATQTRDDGLKAIQARLDERRKTGFGDGVALLSSYFMDSTGQNIQTRSGNVTLYINQGDKWLANQYVLFLPANSLARDVHPVLKEAPEGWPAPNVAKLLPALQAAVPQVSYVMNGRRGAYGSLDKDGTLTMKPATREKDGEMFSHMTLTSQLWPRKELTGIGAPGRGTTDGSLQPGNMLRLRNKGGTTARDGAAATYETTYLLDLGKDDLPAEWYRNMVEKDELVERLAVHYTRFEQLPNGAWYPGAWTQTTLQRDPETGADRGSVQQYRLQVLPGAKVDDDWFKTPSGG